MKTQRSDAELITSDYRYNVRPTLLVRADATQQIGSGHLMRALALAQGWQLRGGQVVFATHCDSEALCARIDTAGISRIPLNAAHPAPADMTQTLELIARLVPAWTILDGYHFTSCYQQTLQKTGCPLLVIDDMAHHSCYHADVILNQNIYADKLTYTNAKETRFLLGARYALLRPEFAPWLLWRRILPRTARNVLVTLGGVDLENVTKKVIQALTWWPRQDLSINIIVGPGNPHRETLHKAIAQSGQNMNLLTAPSDMPSLMAWADVAIAAAGTTALELAYMQVPTIAIVLADNQSRVAEAFHSRGSLQNLGWHTTVFPEALTCALRHLINNVSLRQVMAYAGRELVDGGCTQCVINELWK